MARCILTRFVTDGGYVDLTRRPTILPTSSGTEKPFDEFCLRILVPKEESSNSFVRRVNDCPITVARALRNAGQQLLEQANRADGDEDGKAK